ncbi:MAG: DUF3987 domain-containing protein [Bacteroidales bacterium]|nr:DUF3987 domain-containing protein [Bacteroidales bacterium]
MLKSDLRQSAMLCPGDMLVSVFSSIVPNNVSAVHLISSNENSLQSVLRPKLVCKLKDFLCMGEKYRDVIDSIRTIEDKKARNHAKVTKLPAATISANLSTRDSKIPLVEKMVNYNPLVVMDFDNVEDIDFARKIIQKFDFVYYCGLSVSGNGLFAIVLIDNIDYTGHLDYFTSLVALLEGKGLKVDSACKDVTRLRVLSYDDNAYFNESCIPFCIQDYNNEEELEENITDNSLDLEKVEAYVKAWEDMEIVLDDYDEWRTVGMALSSLGEPGRDFFDRVSRSSSKYAADDVAIAFDNYLKTTKDITIGSFFYVCHMHGVRSDRCPNYECIPFPIEIFPIQVRDIICTTQRCLNFPADYIGPAMLFTASIALGNALSLEIKRGWHEKAIFYIAIVGEPGTNKSSCLEFAIEPLRKMDRDNLKAYKKKLKVYEAEKNSAELKSKSFEEPPVYGQVVLSDITVEGFLKQHLNTPRGVAIYADELMGFFKSFSRYRSGNDEEIWTQLFTGVPIIVNRLHSESFTVDSPFVGVIGGVQPALLKKFADGKIESGFIYRWLFAFPDRRSFARFQDEEIGDETVKAWSEVISKIRSIKYNGKTKVIRFTDGAYQMYRHWFNSGRDIMERSSASFVGVNTKMERYCARFALVIEVIKFACGESDLSCVTSDSLRRAFRLCYYFIAGAQKAQKRFYADPLSGLNEKQKSVYMDLPITFSTREGVDVAKMHSMSERTFKDWIKSPYFRKLDYGSYEKKYK